MNSPADPDDTGRLRAEWLQYRSRLNDPETGLPTLAGIVDDLRRQLENGLPLGVFTLSLHAERQLEESWGWQAYDRLVVEFIRTLKADRGNGTVPEGLLCLPAVRADEVFLFLPLENDRTDGSSPTEWLADRAGRLDQYVKRFLAQRLPSADRFRNYVGASAIFSDPKVRVERLKAAARRSPGEGFEGTDPSGRELEDWLKHRVDLRLGDDAAKQVRTGDLRSYRPVIDLASRLPERRGRCFINLSPAAASDREAGRR